MLSLNHAHFPIEPSFQILHYIQFTMQIGLNSFLSKKTRSNPAEQACSDSGGRNLRQ